MSDEMKNETGDEAEAETTAGEIEHITVEDIRDQVTEDLTPEPTFDVTDIDAILEQKTGMTKTVQVQLNGNIAQQILDLQAAIIEARTEDRGSERDLGYKPKAPPLIKQLTDVLEQSKATEVPFTFKSIGRPAYEALLIEFRPTQKQKQEGYEFDVNRFPWALVADCSVTPKIDRDKAKEMFSDDRWNNAELLKLFFAAQSCNTELPDIPLSNSAIAGIIDTGQKLTTASNMESPTPSS